MRASSNEVAETLLNVAQTMISKLDFMELLPLILEQLATLVQFTSASIMLIEDDNLRVVARKSALGTGAAPFAVKLDSLAHVQSVLQEGQPVIIDDTRADPRWLHRRSNDAIRSWLGVPLLVKGQVIGLLNVSDTKPAFFNQSDVDILRTFAAFAAITLDNARLYALAQQARAAAEQAASAKAAFLANMSHEIRTPMNAVIGAASLLQCTGMTAEQQEYAATIHVCGDNLLSLINEILDFSKFEAGQASLAAEPFELHECIEEAIAIVAPTALDKGLDIAYAISPKAPDIIVGDQARLRQVLVNLLGNAVKFTEQGEVTVRVEPAAEAGKAPDGAEAPGAASCTLHFAVQDSGIGIAHDQMHALFEPFSQVDTTRTRKYGGTGLGLAICKRLVRLMNGSISVESEPGIGSTFKFNIQAGIGAVRSQSALPVLRPQGRVLLVAKDNKSRVCLLEQLHSLGVHATAADSLLSGREWQSDTKYAADVLLIDSNLLGSNEAQAGEVWTEQLATVWPRRILLAGSVNGMSDFASRHGFQHYLSKPIKRKSLHMVLSDAFLGQRPTDTAPQQAVTNGHNDVAMAPLHILLAEDNLDNQKIIERMIKKLGHQVDLAANGRQAADAAATKPYDVILMDLHMPVMDGLEATRQIRQMPQQTSPRIVALTADVMQETQQACQEVGMDGCLCKPLKFEQLTRLLRKFAQA